MPSCGYDCFTCPFADCIFDEDEDLFEETALEIAESEERDREAVRERCEADFETEAQAQRQRELARVREIKKKNRAAYEAQEAAYRAANRETIREKNAVYWQKNARHINARRNERRHRKRALRQAEKQHKHNRKGGNKTNGKTGK